MNQGGLTGKKMMMVTMNTNIKNKDGRINIKTSELIGPALNWAVAKCEGIEESSIRVFAGEVWVNLGLPGSYIAKYSTDWAQGGPIIEREKISVQPSNEWPLKWIAYKSGRWAGPSFYQHGDTPLIAAMRCYVFSKLGDEIKVPTELQPKEHQ